MFYEFPEAFFIISNNFPNMAGNFFFLSFKTVVSAYVRELIFFFYLVVDRLKIDLFMIFRKFLVIRQRVSLRKPDRAIIIGCDV